MHEVSFLRRTWSLVGTCIFVIGAVMSMFVAPWFGYLIYVGLLIFCVDGFFWCRARFFRRD